MIVVVVVLLVVLVLFFVHVPQVVAVAVVVLTVAVALPVLQVVVRGRSSSSCPPLVSPNCLFPSKSNKIMKYMIQNFYLLYGYN